MCEEEVDFDEVNKKARKVWNTITEKDDGEKLSEKEMKILAAEEVLGDKINYEDIYTVISLLNFISQIHEENEKQKMKENEIEKKDEKETPGFRYG